MTEPRQRGWEKGGGETKAMLLGQGTEIWGGGFVLNIRNPPR